MASDERGHYELLYTGWEDWRRVHGSVIHIDVRGDKVWIQHDGTEAGVAHDLPCDLFRVLHVGVRSVSRPLTGR
jgi:hypothetical protein